MADKNQKSLYYLFETSWEVCNKVGGIYTVIATKAQNLVKQYADKYILIGPDLWQHAENPYFEQDDNLFKSWQIKAKNSGLRIRVGRWKIDGMPIAILVDFSHYNSNKNQILKYYWEKHQLDSFNSSWDYIESVLFGYASARVIESFVQFYTASREVVVAHFHEWMTASGLLYLNTEMPKIATVFTTHATVVGRCVAGNGASLYQQLEYINADESAYHYGVQHKHFIEKKAAHLSDRFTTVSDLTAKECLHILSKEVDVVTPNGFSPAFVPDAKAYASKRVLAQEKLKDVARKVTGCPISDNVKIVGISGRYEFRNKGIDVFIKALGMLNQSEDTEPMLAYILIPTLYEGEAFSSANRYTTHKIPYVENDVILQNLAENKLYNSENDKVKVVFVPCYLDGNDGAFNLPYYDVLIGFDATVFPSYYEPWGYTPLESLAFGVPSITTDKSGFGLWVKKFCKGNHGALQVLDRTDNNYFEVSAQVKDTLLDIQKLSVEQCNTLQNNAKNISEVALWNHLVKYYYDAYKSAYRLATDRVKQMPIVNTESIKYLQMIKEVSSPYWRSVMVNRSVPKSLSALEELSKNLWWCWNLEASELFRGIDPDKWNEVQKNPILLLDSLGLSRYKELEKDTDFMARLKAVHTDFKSYMSAKKTMKSPTIAYFSMEYGLHTSLKIYSGGLGILAGDYLKEASDKATSIVGVGLLYRYGYFTQKLSSAGNQEAEYEAQDFSKIPVTPVFDNSGNWLTIALDYPGRQVKARIWRVDIGRIELYLLDTDIEENLVQDRSITHHLYGGDWENRLKQEMLLGLGGIRLLRTLGIDTDVYHCNEGHAAFIGLERLAEYVEKDNLSFSEALEVVRATSLFTTHTPVPAGHDFFEEGMLKAHIESYASRLRISWKQLLSLGKINVDNPSEKFSMSFLAANLSQEVNGVSWLHGEVSRDIFKDLWPGYLPEELHISYVTNGVHQPTWTSAEWKRLQQKIFGSNFRIDNYDPACFEKIYDVSDEEIMQVRNTLRSKLVRRIKEKLSDEKSVSYFSPRQIVEIKDNLRDDILTIGFARRFATYKRAHLLFSNIERLNEIVNNPERPVQFVFAGKAHPADKAGQDLIKLIVEVSKLPQFLGKILFMPNYDMDLAKTMIQGVDIWMNTPTRPQEASGTSGEKAVMNGVMHFSVLDGWWVEGYREDAGWCLPQERTYENQEYQNQLDSELIYNIIEDQIAPAFYAKNEKGVSQKWSSYIKNTIAKVAVNFTTRRMLTDYENQYYYPMEKRGKHLKKNAFENTIELAQWKQKVINQWNQVQVESINLPDTHQFISVGNAYKADVCLEIGDLSINDIGVELVVSETKNNQQRVIVTKPFAPVKQEGTKAYYELETTTELPGMIQFAIRVYPKHKELPHRQDFALVKWI